MVVTIFRSRLRPDVGEEYSLLAVEMLEFVKSMRGFRSFKTFSSDDGERVSIVEFDSMRDLEAWRDNPEHRRAQALGRERFYTEYSIHVCKPVRASSFTAKDERSETRIKEGGSR